MDFNFNQQPQSQQKIMENFWKNYTKQFFDFNLRQLAELSGQYQMPMPLPQKIEDLGTKHLKQFFLELWNETTSRNQSNVNDDESMANENVKTNGASNMQSDAGASYNYNNDADMPMSSVSNADSQSVNRNVASGGAWFSNINQNGYKNSNNSSTMRRGSSMAQANDHKNNKNSQMVPYRRNSQRGGRRGNFSRFNARDPRINRFKDNRQKSPLDDHQRNAKRSLTDWSDDETSEKVASGTEIVKDNTYNYSKTILEDLGF